MHTVLVAAQRADEIPEQDDLYGWLVGAWDAEVRDRMPDGSWCESRGEWHFARVLEGRAVQDVWIVPPLAARGARGDDVDRYGTTFRVYDRASGTWRVTWFNPVSGSRTDLVGRRDGADILQEGVAGDGRRMRWVFTDITPSSFLWLGSIETDTGWQVEAEFRARRRSG
jgi:hypothetical protein